MNPSEFDASAPPDHTGVPNLLDIVYRHGIGPEDDFRMRPGWRNLMPVAMLTPVADDRHGPVRSPLAGWMVMPLYQGQGADGFFIATAHPER
jgi:succinylglutamate desuccinylase